MLQEDLPPEDPQVVSTTKWLRQIEAAKEGTKAIR